MSIDLGPAAALFFVISLVPAMLLHELAHGWLAVWMGDPTPRMMGRLTLHPAKHVEAFGSVIVPALLLLPVVFGRGGAAFGYLRPMPINRENLRDPDRQMTWIALAGILTNLALAVLGAVALRVLAGAGDFLEIWVFTNVLMAMLHVVPVPPLDGSRILARFLPHRARAVYESWEPYGALFVLFLLFILPSPILGLVGAAVDGLLNLLVG